MVKAIKSQEETTEKLNSLDDIFRLVFDGALNNHKEAREIHTKNKTLVKNFANVVLSINEFINTNPQYQHVFKDLLDKRGLNLPSLEEINKSLKEQEEEQESDKDEKKVIDYYNGKFYGI